jgi:1-acyl-sn-glycerol-3-phosphate acyltransferase
MIFLRSVAFALAFFLMTTISSILMIWVLLLPKRFVIATSAAWVKAVGWLERNIVGITWRAEGREHIPAGACIIAAKHQSAWETFKLGILFDGPAVVLKRELLWLPIWGWYLARAGGIAIDRARGARSLTGMMRAARRMAAEGRKIVIFPQGTRVPPGEKRPYKKGVVLLYEELSLPIVPMAVNSGLLWPKGSFLKKPGCITIEFLPPIPPGLERMEMMKRLETKLEEASDRLAGI